MITQDERRQRILAMVLHKDACELEQKTVPVIVEIFLELKQAGTTLWRILHLILRADHKIDQEIGALNDSGK